MSKGSVTGFGLSVLSLLMAVAVAQGQATWYVDDDAQGDPGAGDPTVSDPAEDGSVDHPFDAIQEGINAAGTGHIVLVFDGTYTGDGNRDLDFGGKLITVRSKNGPANCVVDCQGSNEDPHGGFYFHSGETEDAVVDGFTVRQAFSNGGGGVHVDSAGPTIRNCTIVDNTAAAGGGVYCTGTGSPMITNCTISANSAWNEGGGLSIHGSSSPVVSNCTISGNTTGQFGGGVFLVTAGSATITNCTISGNTAISQGGGVTCFAFGGTSLFSHCTITDNTAAFDGGGVWVMGGSLMITNSTISGNRADSQGGGLRCFYNSTPTLTNCIITGNKATDQGGGIVCGENSAATIVGCTITGNSATNVGGGVVCDAVSGATISNSILWGNTGYEVGSQIVGEMVTASYSCIQNGWDGAGNTAEDPLLTALGSWDDNGTPSVPDDDVWIPGDEHLLPSSFCINAGRPDYDPSPGETDLDRHARVLCGRVDMGADEFGIGDYDCDQTVDLFDFAYWAACMTGPYGGPYGAGCEAFDFEFDGDVDLEDFAGFMLAHGQ